MSRKQSKLFRLYRRRRRRRRLYHRHMIVYNSRVQKYGVLPEPPVYYKRYNKFGGGDRRDCVSGLHASRSSVNPVRNRRKSPRRVTAVRWAGRNRDDNYLTAHMFGHSLSIPKRLRPNALRGVLFVREIRRKRTGAKNARYVWSSIAFDATSVWR